jgi:hypothetical protein
MPIGTQQSPIMATATATTAMSIMEGPLSKWTNMLHGWQFRWFVLDQANGLLSYYTSKENISKGERRGCIRLKDGPAYVGYDSEDDITFTITVDDKTFHLQARNLSEREKWVNKIDRTIRMHANSSSQAAAAAAVVDASSSLDKFDSSLVESDAYLQILIEQLKGLEKKREMLKQTGDLSPLAVENNGGLLAAESGSATSLTETESDLPNGGTSSEDYTKTDEQNLNSIISATEVIN